MQAYKARNKDKLVKIYIKAIEEQADGEIITKKIYLQPKGISLKAYIRSTSNKERETSNQVQPSNDIEVTINYRRELDLRIDAYLEYQNRTYAITGIDILDFQKTEMKLTASSIEPPKFDAVEYLERKKIVK